MPSMAQRFMVPHSSRTAGSPCSQASSMAWAWASAPGSSPAHWA